MMELTKVALNRAYNDGISDAKNKNGDTPASPVFPNEFLALAYDWGYLAGEIELQAVQYKREADSLHKKASAQPTLTGQALADNLDIAYANGVADRGLASIEVQPFRGEWQKRRAHIDPPHESMWEKGWEFENLRLKLVQESGLRADSGDSIMVQHREFFKAEPAADGVVKDSAAMPADLWLQTTGRAERPKHSHYYRPCPYDAIDVYRILEIFEVNNPCAQHAIKKLLVMGNRGHKDAERDVQDVIDTMTRWKAMRAEESK